jgi:hypothetical protein
MTHSGVPCWTEWPALSTEAVRRLLDKVEKQMEETKNLFHFTLCARDDNRLVGLARIFGIDFHNGTGVLDMGVGDSSDRRVGRILYHEECILV